MTLNRLAPTLEVLAETSVALVKEPEVDLYLILVYLHILGTVAFFASLGVEAVAVQRVRRASTIDDVRTWLPVLRQPGGRIGHVGMLTILVTGIWMMLARWDVLPWMITALAAVVGIIAVAVAVAVGLGAPLRQLTEGLGSQPPGGTDWRRLITAPRLSLSLWLRVGVAVGVLGLMTVKPALGGSLAILAGGIALGLTLSRVAQRTTTSQSYLLAAVMKEENT